MFALMYQNKGVLAHAKSQVPNWHPFTRCEEIEFNFLVTGLTALRFFPYFETLVVPMLRKEDFDHCWSSAEDGGPCKNPAVFKIVILGNEGTDNREKPIPAGVGITFVCRECLPDAIERTPDPPELAYMVLPLRLTKEQVKL